MRICYLLESTDLWGGVRIVFDQVRGLTRLGHQVSVRAISGDHRWYPYPVNIEYVKHFAAPFPQNQKPNIVVCTYWSTVQIGMKIDATVTVHLCQGYEGDFLELKNQKTAIEQAYTLPIPKLFIGKWLEEEILGKFGAERFPAFTIGEIIDTKLFKPERFSVRRMMRQLLYPKVSCRVLVVGDYGISWKGIADALKAVALLRAHGEQIRLMRVSLFPRSDEENAITPVDESNVRVDPIRMPSLYKRADLLLAPSWSNEGFGLPFAEALASGVPAVATKIPSYLGFDETHDYACFVEPHDTERMAKAAQALLHNRQLADRLSIRGPQVIHEKFHIDTISKRIEFVFQELLANTDSVSYA